MTGDTYTERYEINHDKYDGYDTYETEADLQDCEDIFSPPMISRQEWAAKFKAETEMLVDRLKEIAEDDIPF